MSGFYSVMFSKTVSIKCKQKEKKRKKEEVLAEQEKVMHTDSEHILNIIHGI